MKVYELRRLLIKKGNNNNGSLFELNKFQRGHR